MIESLILDPKIKVRDAKDLIDSPRVIRVNNFDDDSVKAFSTSMAIARNTGQPIIPVVIDSYGGEVYSLFAMIDIIKMADVPVATIIQGKAMSCGAVLFTCGTEGYRFMGPNSTLMIHDVSSESSWDKVEEYKVNAKEMDRINKRVYNIMDRNCGHKPGYTWDLVQERVRTDWYLNPKQAVQHNYANHVSIPRLTTRVKVEVEFKF